MLGLLAWLYAVAAASGLTSYRATKADFKALEDGSSDARLVTDSIFPEGIDAIDFVLYDARDLYVYSQRTDYPFKKVRRWRGYQVYRLAHKGHPTERELARCAGLGMAGVTRQLRGKIAEQSWECAPLGTFLKIQKKRRSIYQYKEGYLASIIHEYGHQYEDQQPGGLPAVVALNKIVKEVPYGTNRDSAVNEAFADYCELKASQRLFPDHFDRMKREAADKNRPEDQYGHEAGLRAAVELLESETSKGAAK